MRLTKFVLMACMVGTNAYADDYADDARKAAALCLAMGMPSMVACGTMVGRTEQHSEARRAVQTFFQARARAMAACETDQPFASCTFDMEWRAQSGIDKAMQQVYGYR